MNIRELHNIVKSAKSQLLQEQNNINNVMIDDYITEELHRRTQRNRTTQKNNSIKEYDNSPYDSLERLTIFLLFLLKRLKKLIKNLFKFI